MNFGAHISSAGGVEHVPERAGAVGAECVQFFTASPRGKKQAEGRGKSKNNGKEKPVGAKSPTLAAEKAPAENPVAMFKKNREKYGIKGAYIHTPYFINLASKNNRIYYGSISAIRKDLEEASILGAEAVVTHIGSARDFTAHDRGLAVEHGKRAIRKILEGYEGTAELLLEISAGAGQILGVTLEEMADFLEADKKVGGICFDTAHAFESGLDLSSPKKMTDALDLIEQIIGMEKLRLVHINDSKTPLGSHKDRHEHLGMGEIGLPAFMALIADSRMKKMDFILETPSEQGLIDDLKVLKGMRE